MAATCLIMVTVKTIGIQPLMNTLKQDLPKTAIKVQKQVDHWRPITDQ